MDHNEGIAQFTQYLNRRFPGRRTVIDYVSDVHQFVMVCPEPWRSVTGPIPLTVGKRCPVQKEGRNLGLVNAPVVQVSLASIGSPTLPNRREVMKRRNVLVMSFVMVMTMLAVPCQPISQTLVQL
jgi:hypothetical protein